MFFEGQGLELGLRFEGSGLGLRFVGGGVVCAVCIDREMTSFRGNVFWAAKCDEMLRGYEIGAGRERVTLLGVRVAGPLPPAVFLRSVRRAKRQSTLAHCAPRPGPLKLARAHARASFKAICLTATGSHPALNSFKGPGR